ncbi:MAG: hypothetical protein GX892_04830 [Thermoanaerobacteraceae bacterium]|nr:hypothetical protein [Thermoanaerobacteraceae bacterium]
MISHSARKAGVAGKGLRAKLKPARHTLTTDGKNYQEEMLCESASTVREAGHVIYHTPY